MGGFWTTGIPGGPSRRRDTGNIDEEAFTPQPGGPTSETDFQAHLARQRAGTGLPSGASIDQDAFPSAHDDHPTTHSIDGEFMLDRTPRPVTAEPAELTGLRERAFRSGTADWKNDGSIGEIDSDAAAQHYLDQKHQRALADIDAIDKARGNPQDDAIEALERTHKYEQLLPADARSHLSYGDERTDHELMDLAEEHGVSPDSGMTRGESQAARVQEARLRTQLAGNVDNIKRAGLYDGLVRQRAMLDLLTLPPNVRSGKVHQLVQSGQMSQEEADRILAREQMSPDGADAEWTKGIARAKDLAEILRRGAPKDGID